MHIQIDIHIDRKGDKTKTAYIIDDVCMGIHCTSLSTFLYVWKINVLKYFKMGSLYFIDLSLKADFKSFIFITYEV